MSDLQKHVSILKNPKQLEIATMLVFKMQELGMHQINPATFKKCVALIVKMGNANALSKTLDVAWITNQATKFDAVETLRNES